MHYANSLLLLLFVCLVEDDFVENDFAIGNRFFEVAMVPQMQYLTVILCRIR